MADLECPNCQRLQVWAQNAWARGHLMGMQANRQIAKEATDALAKEREAHANTNALFTELLLESEEKLNQLLNNNNNKGTTNGNQESTKDSE